MTHVHPGINIELQYIRSTSEYILKLQLHQHSLLTRKVFTRHNLSAQVFFFVSSGSSSGLRHLQIHLHLQVIFICKSSSLDLDHLSIWSIITGSGSSLDIDHHGTSSLDLDHLSIWIIITGLDLDHYCWIIITGFGSTLVLSHDSSRHRKFYRASPFSCWL